MTQKVYRTAKGKAVDLGALMLQHENVKAVGNMGVNARGDKVDPEGKVIETVGTQASRQYNSQVSNVKQTKVASSKKADENRNNPKEIIQGFDPDPNDVQQPIVDSVVSVPPVVDEDPEISPELKKPTGGLAAAIAAAKSIRQDALKSPREESRTESGVKKI